MGNYLSLALQLISSVVFAFFTIKLIKPVAIDFGLVDTPCSRKQHSGDVPLIGGIAVFLAVLLATFLWVPNTQELRLYLIASAMMVFIGALDDKFDLRVRYRFAGQLIVASLMIYGIGAYITELGNIFALGNVTLGWLAIPFTYFAIIVAINAFNMIDGMDGLIGSLSICTLTAIAVLFLWQGSQGYVSYALIIAAAILPFLLFNLGILNNNSRKIFMGDAGSMFIGLSIVWLLVVGSQGEAKSFRPVTALYLAAIPLMDMLAIVIRRIKKGKAPFKPDRDHIHHILQRLGYNQRQALAIIVSMAIIMVSLGIVGEVLHVQESVMLAFFLLMFMIYHSILRSTKMLSRFIKSSS